METGTARHHTAKPATSASEENPWPDHPHALTPCARTEGAVIWAGSERPATWLGVGERAGWLRMRRAEAPPAGSWVRLGVRAAPFASGFAWTAATVRATHPVDHTGPMRAAGKPGAAVEVASLSVDLLVERRVRPGLRPSLFERVARRLLRD